MNDSFKVAGIFTDHMVIQRDVEFPVWGKAEDGKRIEIEFCNQKRITHAVKGTWTVKLPPVKAGGPYEMRISDGDTTIIFKDILVGEVWLAGGQSNMQMELKHTNNAEEEIALADYPEIRYYNVPIIPYETATAEYPEKYSEKAEWKVCSSETAGKCSAVAYYFAREIYKALGVPIGIINCSYGGTSASCWMSEKYLSDDLDVKSYLDDYYEAIADLDPEEYKKEHKNYEIKSMRIAAFMNEVKEGRLKPEEAQEIIKKEGIPRLPMGPKNIFRPCGLYYTMLRKITPYSIKGVIFYQGEADDRKPRIYGKLFSRMIQNWRDDWNYSDMPFLFVQLPKFAWLGNPDGDAWALLREQQSIVEKTVPRTAMAVSFDCGDENDVHPREKRPIGERLALLARAKVYGEDIQYSGPVLRKMRIEGNKAILYFDHVGKGLVAKGDTLKGFKICAKNKKFVDGTALINGDTVVVFNEDIEQPWSVRYGWANYAEINLYNKDGLPAGPFRTDIYS